MYRSEAGVRELRLNVFHGDCCPKEVKADGQRDLDGPRLLARSPLGITVEETLSGLALDHDHECVCECDCEIDLDEIGLSATAYMDNSQTCLAGCCNPLDLLIEREDQLAGEENDSETPDAINVVRHAETSFPKGTSSATQEAKSTGRGVLSEEIDFLEERLVSLSPRVSVAKYPHHKGIRSARR